MYIVIEVPEEYGIEVLAQDIVDRYCNIEYYDVDMLEDYEIPSVWYQLKQWFRAYPLSGGIK